MAGTNSVSLHLCCSFNYENRLNKSTENINIYLTTSKGNEEKKNQNQQHILNAMICLNLIQMNIKQYVQDNKIPIHDGLQCPGYMLIRQLLFLTCRTEFIHMLMVKARTHPHKCMVKYDKKMDVKFSRFYAFVQLQSSNLNQRASATSQHTWVSYLCDKWDIS